MRPTFAEQYKQLDQWHWWFRGRRRILETVLQREVPPSQKLAVVSVGCGPGTGLTWVKTLIGADGCVVGLDAEPLHAREVEQGLLYVVGRLEDIPLASSSFDVVLALDVLEHLDDDVAGLYEAVRLLRPNGVLVVTVPALPLLWGGQDVISEHKRRYTKRSLLEVFARAQLPRPTVTYFNTFLFPLIASIRMGRALFGDTGQSYSDFSATSPGLTNEALATVFALERHLIGRVPIPIGVSLLATLHLSPA